jgi:hypothetical protein|nr:MAG TPA: hypothetical protein [Bacteriophage sp.]
MESNKDEGNKDWGKKFWLDLIEKAKINPYAAGMVTLFAVLTLIAILISVGSGNTSNSTTAEKQIKERPKVDTASEKRRIYEELIKLEDYHLPSWNALSESLAQSNKYESYSNARKSEDTLINIWSKLRDIKCNTTGDSVFDEKCEEILKQANNAYSAKRMATKELMKWLDDNSPKKLYEAENAMKYAASEWKSYQMLLAKNFR